MSSAPVVHDHPRVATISRRIRQKSWKTPKNAVEEPVKLLSDGCDICGEKRKPQKVRFKFDFKKPVKAKSKTKSGSRHHQVFRDIDRVREEIAAYRREYRKLNDADYTSEGEEEVSSKTDESAHSDLLSWTEE